MNRMRDSHGADRRQPGQRGGSSVLVGGLIIRRVNVWQSWPGRESSVRRRTQRMLSGGIGKMMRRALPQHAETMYGTALPRAR